MDSVECLYDKYIKNFRCKYYMTKTTKNFIDQEEEIKTFGVKIDKISSKGNVVSTAYVDDVGINEQDVRSFIKCLNDGSVTPITLRDIVSDKLV